MIHRIFARLDRIGGQWLAAWTLSALVATLAFLYVLSGVGKSLREKTGYTLVDLQVSGSYEVLGWTGWVKSPTPGVLRKWRETGVLEDALRSQKIDFWFPPAYGAFYLLLAAAMRRCHPKYPNGAQWVWCLSLGTIAAALDELENIGMWFILLGNGDPGWILPALASLFAIPKLILLLVFLPVTFLLALRRAQA